MADTPSLTRQVVLKDVEAVDSGGVSRDVYSRAGVHIKTMLKRIGNFYMIPDTLPEKDARLLGKIFAMSYMQGYRLGVPLCYGTLYAVKHHVRTVPYKDMDLALLIFLYSHDDPEDLEIILQAVDNDEVRDTLVYHQFQVTALGENPVTRGNVLEWLRRYLINKLYGTNIKTTAFISGFNSAIYEQPEHIISTLSLPRLSEMCGSDITALEFIELLRAGAPDTPAAEVLLDMIQTYLYENDQQDELDDGQHKESPDDKAAKLAKFITGSTSPEELNLTIVTSHTGLPVAHTCFSRLDVKPYKRKQYKKFKHDLLLSLSSMDTFDIN